MSTSSTALAGPWSDPARPAAERAAALIAELTIEEKVAQLYGVWVGASDQGGEVAPHQHEMEEGVDFDELLPSGLGQLTRPFGTAPVDPALGALSLMRTQRRIVAENRFGIPALAHEECLAGFATWGATAYPVPLSWGATFNPELVQQMSSSIGHDMRSVGVHQGLAPVLDVVRDPRWGRVEETIGEDPYLVGSIATAYIKGLESSRIVATLKHFVGYSASKAGRNLAPVSIGRRELADVLLPPFEMAVRESGVRSVMHAYTDIDGVPSAADSDLLTGLLRETWGFEGTVVADYFGIAFLRTLHAVAGSWEEAAEQALSAGVDVELPTVKAYGAPLAEAVRAGRIKEELLDRALERVLIQKIQLGMLDPEWSPVPESLQNADLSDPSALRETIDLDSPRNRALARELAEQAVVLLANDGILPLAAPKRIAVIGPTANDPMAVLGCYSFPAHVGAQHPETPIGLRLPTLLESLKEEFPASEVTFLQGTSIDGGELDELADAAQAAADADLVVLALGDRAGLFGRGTSGEGCDAGSLALPGAQQALLDQVLAAGTPAVVVLLSGRPYALSRQTRSEAGAIIQAFFPGEEGTGAIAGVLSGRVNPSGRLPVSIPGHPDAQPATYLAPALGRKTSVSNIDPTPAFAFGHGLSYTSFEWSDLEADADSISTDGTVRLTVRIRNVGTRSGADIVQLYLHDPVASVVRPLQRLIGYQRIDLDPSEEALLTFEVPAELGSFTGRDGRRIVEPGEIVLGLGRSSTDIVLSRSVTLTGPTRVVDHTRALHPLCTVSTSGPTAASPEENDFA